jgi:hypothetical protein
MYAIEGSAAFYVSRYCIMIKELLYEVVFVNSAQGNLSLFITVGTTPPFRFSLIIHRLSAITNLSIKCTASSSTMAKFVCDRQSL